MTIASGIALVPAPVERLGGDAELDDEVVAEILRLGLAALFLPQPDQRRFVRAHDDPRVRAADESAGGHGFSNRGKLAKIAEGDFHVISSFVIIPRELVTPTVVRSHLIWCDHTALGVSVCCQAELGDISAT